MKELKQYINEKLVINKNFINVKDDLEERLFDLLGYTSVIDDKDDETKHILNWIRNNSMKDFRIYITKNTYSYMATYWNGVSHSKNTSLSSYIVINESVFEKMYDKYWQSCNCDYDTQSSEVMTNSETLLYNDKFSNLKFIVKASK